MHGEMAAFVEYFKSSQPIDPTKPVLAPGEPERASVVERTAHGIPIAADTWSTRTATARRLGVGEAVIAGTLR